MLNKNIINCLGILLVHLLQFLPNDVFAKQVTPMVKNYYEELMNDTSVSIVRQINYADSILRFATNQIERNEILFRKADLCRDAGLSQRSVQTYTELAKYLDKYPVDKKCKIINGLARSYFYMIDYKAAISQSHNILTLQKPDSLGYYDVLANTMIVAVYNRLGRPDLVNKYIKEAEKTFDKTKKNYPEWRQRDLLAEIHMCKAKTYLIKDEYDKAFEELKIAHQLAQSPVRLLTIDVEKTLIYLKVKEFGIAEAYCKKILASKIQHYNKGVAVNNYIAVLVELHKFDNALKVYEENQDAVELLNGDITMSHIHHNLAEAYEGLHNYAKAYSHMHRSKIILDSLSNVQKRIISSTSSYEEEETQSEQTKLKDKLKIAIIVILVAAIALAVLAVYLLRMIKLRNRSKLESNQLKSIIAENEKHENSRVQDIRNAVETKNRELTAMTLKLSQIRDAVDAALAVADDATLSDSTKISQIRTDLKTLNLQDDVWGLFQTYFEQIHQNFFANLCSAHPNLTTGEIRMCAFIILNLTTKEIAALTNRSSRTIDTIKYRLHNKLGAEESTRVYLQRFL